MILSDEGKVFACICIALFIFIITALLLGEERKSKCRRVWSSGDYVISYWPIFLYYIRFFLKCFAANKECIP